MSLTKSLHTVTAVANVARHLHRTGSGHTDAPALTAAALQILGYTVDARREARSDDTVARCVAAVAKVLQP
jgi:hypothetical protein